MQIVRDRFPGLVLLARLNADWVLAVAMVAFALLAGSYFGAAVVAN
jgi:hypothetical protein